MMLAISALAFGLVAGDSCCISSESSLPARTPVMFMQPTYMPISRVIENLEARLSEEPENRQNYLNLARAHSYAFQIADRSKVVEMRAVLRYTPSQMERGIDVPRRGDVPAERVAAGPEYLSMSDRMQHLASAIAAFNKAIEMNPLEPVAYLGMGDLLDACNYEMADSPVLPYPAFPSRSTRELSLTEYLKWFTDEGYSSVDSTIASLTPSDSRQYDSPFSQPGEGVIDALLLSKEEADGERKELLRSAIVKYCRYQVSEYFFKAFVLSIGQDSYRDSQSNLNGHNTYVAWEAGSRYLKAIETFGVADRDLVRIQIVKVSSESLEKLPYRNWVTPIIFSLHNDAPLESLLALETSVDFDLDGTGRDQAWPWLAPETSILVWDPDETGEITSGRQLFGSVTWWLFFDNGYRAMDALDDNRDGELLGDELAGLALWTDANSNAISDPGEVVPIGETSIEAISCRATDEQMGMPANLNGLRMNDGRVLPTYDWVTKPIQQELGASQ